MDKTIMGCLDRDIIEGNPADWASYYFRFLPNYFKVNKISIMVVIYYWFCGKMIHFDKTYIWVSSIKNLNPALLKIGIYSERWILEWSTFVLVELPVYFYFLLFI